MIAVWCEFPHQVNISHPAEYDLQFWDGSCDEGETSEEHLYVCKSVLGHAVIGMLETIEPNVMGKWSDVAVRQLT